MTQEVHSALKNHNQRPTGPNPWAGHGLAFEWDLYGQSQLPTQYADADVLFSVLPWPNGWSVFEERAEATGGNRTYTGFMQSVVTLAESSAMPCYFLTAKRSLSLLPRTWRRGKIRLFGEVVDLVGSGPPITVEPLDVSLFLKALARQYNCVGDFCCGFGQTARIFAECGKRYVASDYNAECVAYVSGRSVE
jgi:hypothetical protein